MGKGLPRSGKTHGTEKPGEKGKGETGFPVAQKYLYVLKDGLLLLRLVSLLVYVGLCFLKNLLKNFNKNKKI